MAGTLLDVSPAPTQQFQMPSVLEQQQQQQQMQQHMSAVAAMAAVAGIAGGSTPSALPGMFPNFGNAPPSALFPPFNCFPGVSAAPSVEQASSFPPVVDNPLMQQYLQTAAQYLQQAAASASMRAPPAFPPPASVTGTVLPPFHGIAATSSTPPGGDPVVQVSVDGMSFQYQLTDDDLMKVFSRYGKVNGINVDEVGTSAQITFDQLAHAQGAMDDLNGKPLAGLDGRLRISWVNSTLSGLRSATPAASAIAPPTAFPVVPPFPGLGFPMVSPPPPWSTASTMPPLPAPAMAGTVPSSSYGITHGREQCLSMPISTPQELPATTGTYAIPPRPVTPPPEPNTATGVAAVVTGEARPPPHVKGVRKYTCRFLINIENDKDFGVVRRIIGAKGANMKRINKASDAKLRLRGRGSGYFEGANHRESTEPLQLCISCTRNEGYKTAVSLAEELLEQIYVDYRSFCQEHGKPVPDLHAVPQVVSGRDRTAGDNCLEDGGDDGGCR